MKCIYSISRKTKTLCFSVREAEWSDFLQQLSVGDTVKGQVIDSRNFGVYLDFGAVFPALVELPNLLRERLPVDADSLPRIGAEMHGRIIQLVPSRRIARAVELHTPDRL